MRTVRCKITIENYPLAVWKCLTNVESISFQKNRVKVDVVEEGLHFIEETGKGKKVQSTITLRIPQEKYEVALEDDKTIGSLRIGMRVYEHGKTEVEAEYRLKGKSVMTSILLFFFPMRKRVKRFLEEVKVLAEQ